MKATLRLKTGEMVNVEGTPEEIVRFSDMLAPLEKPPEPVTLRWQLEKSWAATLKRPYY